MSKLVVIVPEGRRAAGRGLLIAGDGQLLLPPFRVIATASETAARRHDNAGRDWRRPYGHTPTGSYVVAGAMVRALVLSPVAGNALEALRGGRTRFLLVGGRADAEGRLASTTGGLRLAPDDLALLLAAINRANAARDPLSSVEVEETATPNWKRASSDEVYSSRAPVSSRRTPTIPKKVRAELGFAAGAGKPGRRAFIGLALFSLSAIAFGCGGSDDVGTGGSGAGGGGGSSSGAQTAGDGGGDPDAGKPNELPDGGLTTGDGTGTAEQTGGGGVTTGLGTSGDTSGGVTTTGGVTTGGGPDTGTTGSPGTDSSITASPGTDSGGTGAPGTDTSTTGTDNTTTGTDGITTGTDGTTTGTDGTTTGTDGTGTGTGTDTTGTGTGTDTTGTGTGTDTTGTGTDTGFRRPPHAKRRIIPPGEGPGL